MTIPAHHKQIAIHLRENAGETVSIAAYRDSNKHRPIDIGKFGKGSGLLYSTIGISDRNFKIPMEKCEFVAVGKHPWLPNALASSIYWLQERAVSDWPLVCEDVVRQNTKSTYRHMLYIPSQVSLFLKPEHKIGFLLGFPIRDSELQMNLGEATLKVKADYPSWLLRQNA